MPHSRGFRNRADPRSHDAVSVGEVVGGLLSEELFMRGMPIATLATGWVTVMGERLAAETEPATLDEGVLVVRAGNGPWGAQARFLAEQIRVNANEVLGSETVRSVRVVIDPSFSARR